MTPPPSSITGSTARQAPERREERAADLCLDLRFLILRERLGPNRAADVINQDVDAAEARSCPLHRCGRAAKTFQVCDGGERLGSRLLPHLLDEVGPIHEGDASPFPCQPQRDITADALCRASHHGSLASEAVRIGRHRGLTPLAGGSLKKDSVPAIVASSRASLLGGRDRRSSISGPRWLPIGLFGKTRLARLSQFSKRTSPCDRLELICPSCSIWSGFVRELSV
jgi:hypothetical protein